jgi:hypothetical protein
MISSNGMIVRLVNQVGQLEETKEPSLCGLAGVVQPTYITNIISMPHRLHPTIRVSENRRHLL